MTDINKINKSLKMLRARGVNLPSSLPMYQAFFGDIFDNEGLVRVDANPDRLKLVTEGFPELVNERLIVDKEYSSIERMVNNFNNHASPNDRINVDVRSLSVSALYEVKYNLSVREAVSNIYMPEFGMLLKDIIEAAQEDGREI